MNDGTQAVDKEVEASAEPVVETEVAQDEGEDFEAILARYNEEVKPQETPANPPEQDAEELASVRSEIQDLRNQMNLEKNQKDLGDLIQTVVGETGQPDWAARGFIDSQADKDPRFKRAWENRHTDPKGFEKVKQAISREFSKAMKAQPDATVTEDVEAASAAVRGSSNTVPEKQAVDFSGMSNNEYREAHFKEYGYYPSV